MLVDETISVFISYRNLTHYRKLGYNPIIDKNLEIRTQDLPSSSHVKVIVKCSICESEKTIMYCKYIENKKRHGFYGCKKCSRNKAGLTSIHKYGVDNYSKTQDWKERVEKTNKEKFGYKSNLMNPEYQKKIKNILKEKYGTENFFEINRTKKEIKEKFSIKELVYSLIGDVDLSEDRYEDVIINQDYLKYRNECRRITKSNLKNLLNNWDGTDFYDGEKISENCNLNHNDPKYPTLDHKRSIYFGFVNGISPIEIGSIENLCITKRSINSSKCSMNESEFRDRIG